MTPPLAITKRIIPTGLNEWSKIFFNCSPVNPLRIPKKYIAAKVAMVNAKNGFPRNPRIFCKLPGIGMYFEIVLSRIKISGMRITPKTSPNDGSSLPSS